MIAAGGRPEPLGDHPPDAQVRRRRLADEPDELVEPVDRDEDRARLAASSCAGAWSAVLASALARRSGSRPDASVRATVACGADGRRLGPRAGDDAGSTAAHASSSSDAARAAPEAVDRASSVDERRRRRGPAGAQLLERLLDAVGEPAELVEADDGRRALERVGLAEDRRDELGVGAGVLELRAGAGRAGRGATSASWANSARNSSRGSVARHQPRRRHRRVRPGVDRQQRVDVEHDDEVASRPGTARRSPGSSDGPAARPSVDDLGQCRSSSARPGRRAECDDDGERRTGRSAPRPSSAPVSNSGTISPRRLTRPEHRPGGAGQRRAAEGSATTSRTRSAATA